MITTPSSMYMNNTHTHHKKKKKRLETPQPGSVLLREKEADSVSKYIIVRGLLSQVWLRVCHQQVCEKRVDPGPNTDLLVRIYNLKEIPGGVPIRFWEAPL